MPEDHCSQCTSVSCECLKSVSKLAQRIPQHPNQPSEHLRNCLLTQRFLSEWGINWSCHSHEWHNQWKDSPHSQHILSSGINHIPQPDHSCQVSCYKWVGAHPHDSRLTKSQDLSHKSGSLRRNDTQQKHDTLQQKSRCHSRLCKSTCLVWLVHCQDLRHSYPDLAA